jgi:pimeloyl-ACP methyl ester carboxylesterase
MRPVNRRSALIGSAGVAASFVATRAFGQSQGLSQAGTNAVAAARAEHTKLLAQSETQFVGIPSPTAPRGEVGGHPCQGIYWTPKGTPRPRVALIATHYNVDFSEHYIAPYISSRGYGFLGWNTRYRGAEDLFTLEHALIDIGAGVKWLRDQGAERVVILGNSGGGSLMGAYQAEATAATLNAGMQGAAKAALESLPKTDLYISLNAHSGRPEVLTNWLDPSVTDERDPVATDQSLNMYNKDHGPPYSQEFITRYRAAQRARNQRITDWCKTELKRLNAAGIPDYLFPLFRAWADLRFMDGKIDPSDRVVPGTYRGDPATANRGFGLGRACTLRSWLSMWSLETSKCQGPEQLAKFTIPALVIQSRADKGVFLSDAQKMFDAVGSKDKKLELMPGNHYLEDGPETRHLAASMIADWVKARA